LSVSARVKDIDSVVSKAERKNYEKPTAEITDIVGVRVITYIEADVAKVEAEIKKAFRVHANMSLDKGAELGVDKIGYRSVHFVCDIGEKRSELPECSIFSNTLFEIQVRSILQHAWAEIEHDRGYKFSGTLPKHLSRKLNLVAGSLELADSEFNSIAADLDKYSAEVAKATIQGNYHFALDSTTVDALLERIRNRLKKCRVNKSTLSAQEIGEINEFGIKDLSQLESLFTDQFLEAADEHYRVRGSMGIIRAAMMWHDIERYFGQVWKKKFDALSVKTYQLVVSRWGETLVDKCLKNHGVLLDSG